MQRLHSFVVALSSVAALGFKRPQATPAGVPTAFLSARHHTPLSARCWLPLPLPCLPTVVALPGRGQTALQKAPRGIGEAEDAARYAAFVTTTTWRAGSTLEEEAQLLTVHAARLWSGLRPSSHAQF